MQGLIMRTTGSWYEIKAENGTIYKGRLRGKMKLGGIKATNPIAVGDRVEFEMENIDTQTVAIYKILERDNYLVRQSVHKTAHIHIIAANLDQAMLVVTLAMPRTSLGFIDRFLVTCEAYSIPVLIVFNKQDLLSQFEKEELENIRNLYESLGYRTLAVSALADANFTDLEKRLDKKKTLIVGHSGVGKSTLLNRLVPDLALKTGEISNFSEKGKHTTTFAEMFEVREDTYFIDTPGIKELGLFEMEKAEISHYFPEMLKFLNQCRFPNCTHLHEPNCKVLEAVENAEIAESRYRSYIGMVFQDEMDNRK